MSNAGDFRPWHTLFQYGWTYVVSAFFVVGTILVAIFSRGSASAPTIGFGVLFALIGGCIAGAALATFLARGAIVNDSDGKTPDTGVNRTRSARARQPLSPDDPIDALPDVHKDHVKVAGLYSIFTIGDLADINSESAEKLKRAFGKALFLRCLAIAKDCKELHSRKLGDD
jgi:hypothetical protein